MERVARPAEQEQVPRDPRRVAALLRSASATEAAGWRRAEAAVPPAYVGGRRSGGGQVKSSSIGHGKISSNSKCG